MGEVRERVRNRGRITLTVWLACTAVFNGLAAGYVGAQDVPIARAPTAGEARVPSATLSGVLASDGGTFDLRLTTDPQPVRLNEYFELIVDVAAERAAEDRNPVWVGVDVQMPEHAHGMNTRPRREQLGDGRFVFRGLLLHMAGEWEIVLDVAKGRVRERASVRLVVE